MEKPHSSPCSSLPAWRREKGVRRDGGGRRSRSPPSRPLTPPPRWGEDFSPQRGGGRGWSDAFARCEIQAQARQHRARKSQRRRLKTRFGCTLSLHRRLGRLILFCFDMECKRRGQKGQGLCKVSPPVIASRAAAKQSPHRHRGLLRRKDRSSQ